MILDSQIVYYPLKQLINSVLMGLTQHQEIELKGVQDKYYFVELDKFLYFLIEGGGIIITFLFCFK